MSRVQPKLVDEYNEDVKFSSLYKNIANIINKDDVKSIETVVDEEGNQYIKVTYDDGTSQVISDQDRYIDNLTYENGKIVMKRNDGADYTVDLNNQYYTKSEIDSTVSAQVKTQVETEVTTKVEEEVAKQIDENVGDLVDKKVEEATSGVTGNKWEQF